MERIDLGYDEIELKIIPGPVHGFRSDNLPPFDVAERVRMRDHIVVPLARLLPSCVSCEVLPNRIRPPGNIIGFGEARYGFPIKMRAAQRNVYPFRHPSKSSAPVGPYVTITLREALYWPTRNSQLVEWIKAASELKRQGHRIIFIRDTAKASEPIDGFETSPAASVNLFSRAALYAGAAANLFINNGPAWLCWFLGAPCLIFRMVSPDAPCSSQEYFAACGLPPGGQPAYAKRGQRIIWHDDNADVILAAFERERPVAV